MRLYLAHHDGESFLGKSIFLFFKFYTLLNMNKRVYHQHTEGYGQVNKNRTNEWHKHRHSNSKKRQHHVAYYSNEIKKLQVFSVNDGQHEIKENNSGTQKLGKHI